MSQFKEHETVWDEEKIKRLWDYYSRTYPYKEQYFSKLMGKDILKKTQKIIGKLNNKIILDFGCGPGFLLDHIIALKIKAKKYIGLDFSEQSISYLIQKTDNTFPVEGIFVKSLPSPLQDNFVDVCFLVEVLEHLDDKHLDITLKEIYRVLKPKGILIVTTPNNENLDINKVFCPECGCIFHKWQHVRSWTSSSLENVIQNYGFKTLHIIELNFVPESFFSRLYIRIREFIKKEKNNLLGIFYKAEKQ